MHIYFFKFPLVDALGGAELHTLKLARHFAALGHELKLITSDRKLLKLFQDNNLPAQYHFVGWEPTSKWSLLLWPATYLIARARFRKILQEIPAGGVLFMQSLIEKLILTFLLLSTSYKLQAKIIWLEHKIPGRWLKLNPLKFKYLSLAKRVQTVTVSNFAKQEFTKLGVPEDNVHVIYAGVSMTPSSPPPHEEEKVGVVVGILGRLDPEKGAYHFLKIILPHLASHPNWRILIAGEGKDEEKIKQLATGQPQIKLLGFVKNLDEFFSQISVLVYPTKVPESFGISVLEALARGVPVVATKLGALPEIIEHDKNGFLIETGEWIEYLEKMQDPLLYQTLSQNALKFAKNFSETEMLKKFGNLFKTGK